VFVVFVLFIRRKATSTGNAVLLVGPCDSGKTAILSTLVYNQTLPTHTSLQTNTSLVIDVPGHPRIRDQFKEHLPQAKAIVFVVDSSTVSRNGPAVAEHLHRVLHAVTSLPPSQHTPALVVCCHKTDLLKSVSGGGPADQLAINRVRSILERELEKRRISQSGVGVEGLGEEGEDMSEMGGLECSGPGGTFRFAEWEGGEVDFVGTSVTVGKRNEVVDEKALPDGLTPLREWIERLS
ncbi:P-loop containing nucleoside triphosphate hydrolase protein, partial [Gloeophyllum trabeum ATCC 11539]